MFRTFISVTLVLCQLQSVFSATPDTKEWVPSEYDFIIVGAGSSGAAVAARLAEDPRVSVLLLEAGQKPKEEHGIPLLTEKMWVSKETDWQFTTTPQEHACLSLINQIYPYPRGKIVGGCSGVNALVYTRGNKLDFDSWASLGNEGWSYKDIFPYFLKIEDYQVPHSKYEAQYHSVGGPITVTRPFYQSPLVNIFLDAGRELGYHEVDYNAGSQTGFMNPVFNIKNGTRHSTYEGYLKPIENQKNFQLLSEAFVTKILLKDKKAVGVQFEKDGFTWTVKARKEVIISGGAVSSPQLLLVSGIGPKDTLETFKIPVLANLPGVGQNLQDHPIVWGLEFEADEKVSLDYDYAMSPESFDRFRKTKTGPLSTPSAVSGISFVNTKYADKSLDHPDIEIALIANKTMIFPTTPEVVKALFEHAGNGDLFFLFPILLRPKSRGFISIQSDDPHIPPIINPKFLSNPQDAKVLAQGIKIIHQIVQTKAFQRLGVRFIQGVLPGCENMERSSDDELECIARHLTGGLFHPVGTCKMGPDNDPMAVVDSRLRVHGISNLRVVDASVMPLIPSAHTNVPAIMVGEKAADMIKEDWSLRSHEEL